MKPRYKLAPELAIYTLRHTITTNIPNIDLNKFLIYLFILLSFPYF